MPRPPVSAEFLADHVISAVRLAVVVTEENGDILYCNPATQAMTGFSPQELENGSLSRFFTPEDLTHFYPNLLYFARNGQPFEGEIMLRRLDDTRFFCYLLMTPKQEIASGKNRVIFCLQDIDTQKRFERLIRETRFEDLLKIADSIAHELRNPLVGIGGFAARLFKTCAPSPEKERYFEMIMENVERIERVVRNVGSLVSLPQPLLSKVHLSTLLAETIGLYAHRLEEQGVTIDISSDDVVLQADHGQLRRVVEVILENAMDSMGHGGCIRIQGQSLDHVCRIRISDTGRGIRQEDLPFIFIPFYSTKAGGVGIDLALVKRIMENHGGRVEVESRPMEGATFTLEFPLERRRALRVTALEAVGNS